MSSSLKNIELTQDEDIGIITLNNPPKNYLTEPEFVNQKLLKQWLRKEKIKGLIITGNNKVFSAGADLSTIANSEKNISVFKKKIKKGTTLLTFIENLDIPTVSAINGSAFGGGLEIALSTNIRICAENSFFSFPETELGLIPGLNGSLRLRKLIERNKALELILSGDIIDAANALSLGLVDEVVPKKNVLEHSIHYLKKITHGRSMEIINFVVSSMKNSRNLPLKKAMKKELEFFCRLALKEAKNITGLNS